MPYIYHICSKNDWELSQKNGIYMGNARDRHDGFIHMSLPHQVERTALKYYKDQKDLFLLKMNKKNLASHLKFEANSKGEIFPHYYGELTLNNIEVAIPFTVSDFNYKTL